MNGVAKCGGQAVGLERLGLHTKHAPTVQCVLIGTLWFLLKSLNTTM